jgi:hypothetical protein
MNQLYLVVDNFEKEEYRQYIQNLLKQHASMVWDKRIQAQTIFDLENNYYQLIYVGWRDQNRI